MPPKAELLGITYHLCGQHLCGQALCGYAVAPNTPVMLAPRLTLKGGASAAKHWEPAVPMPPKLFLYGRGIVLSSSSSLAVNEARLFLLGGPHIIGRWPALTPTLPGSVTLLPTDEEDLPLAPTYSENLLLFPTAERDV